MSKVWYVKSVICQKCDMSKVWYVKSVICHTNMRADSIRDHELTMTIFFWVFFLGGPENQVLTLSANIRSLSFMCVNIRSLSCTHMHKKANVNTLSLSLSLSLFVSVSCFFSRSLFFSHTHRPKYTHKHIWDRWQVFSGYILDTCMLLMNESNCT